MAKQLYNVVFSGEIYPDKHQGEVVLSLASLMKTDVSSARQLFSGGKYLIKANISYPLAEKYITAFDKVGAVAITESIEGANANKDTKSSTGKSRMAMFAVAGIACLVIGYFVVTEYLLEKPQSAVATSNDSNAMDKGQVSMSKGKGYVGETLSKVDELLVLSQTGTDKASSCKKDLSAHKQDKRNECRQLADYYKKGSSFRMLLDGLPQINQRKFSETATPQQLEQFNRDSDEILNNADLMLDAVSLYTEHLK